MATVIKHIVGGAILYFVSPFVSDAEVPTDGVVRRWLTGVSNVREVLQAPGLDGFGAGESPTFEYSLDNTNGRALALLGPRVRHQVQVLIGGVLRFDGISNTLGMGVEYKVSLEL